MSDRPLILITNDDGIRSPGLLAAAQACAGLGDLLIAAPAVQQTGAGRAKPNTSSGRIVTLELTIDGRPITGYAIDGSPAQVVDYAVLELAARPVALVVSGINYGENLGEGITVSGTIGAALEAASFGLPALAVSRQTEPKHYFSHDEHVDFAVAAQIVRQFATVVLQRGLPAGVDLFKIDVPQDATPQTPHRWTRLSRQPYFHPFVTPRTAFSEPSPLGFAPRFDATTLEAASDIRAVAVDGVVSVTPIWLDMTAPVTEQTLAHWFQQP
jgi:5'-nucleotidase